jgi:hypothetical protein
MKKCEKIVVAVLFICLSNLNLFAQSKLLKEDYSIYETILNNIYAQTLKQSGNEIAFVILNDTVKSDYILSGSMHKESVLEYTYERLSTYKKDLLKDFRESNQNSTKLEKQSPTDYEYNFVSKVEIDMLLEIGRKEYSESLQKCKCIYLDSGSSWQPIRRKYPNSWGIYKFSRIGFSSDKKLALVFLAIEAGDYGDSKFYILEKVDDKWKIKENVGVSSWIT